MYYHSIRSKCDFMSFYVGLSLKCYFCPANPVPFSFNIETWKKCATSGTHHGEPLECPLNNACIKIDGGNFTSSNYHIFCYNSSYENFSWIILIYF